MRCSTDLRQRVLAFVKSGGSKAEAARRFGVSAPSVFNWLKAENPLSYRKPGPRGYGRSKRKLDWTALRARVEAQPDALLKEHAAALAVSTNAVWYALRQMKMSRKKNLGLPRVVTLPKAPQKISQMARQDRARRTKR